jgi:O-antigen ligase
MLKRLPATKPALALGSALLAWYLVFAKTFWRPLRFLSVAIVLFAPTLVVFAEKAVVPLVAAFALLAGMDLLRRREKPHPPASAATLILALLALSALSMLWSVDADRTAQQLGKTTLLAAAGLLLFTWARSIATSAHQLPEDLAFISLLLRSAAVGFVLAGLAYIGVYLYADKGSLHDYARPVVLMLLAIWPLAAALLASGERRLALILAVLGTLAVALNFSQAATLLGLALGLATTGLALLRPRMTAAIVAGAIVAAALAQVLLFWGIADEFSRLAWMPSTFRHRIEIYDLAATAIFERPWTGWGLATFRSLPLEPGDLERFSFVTRVPSHVHGNFVEAWHDLGILGFLLTLALPLAALGWSVRLPLRCSALALGGITSTATIAFVSFGLTQSAWLGILIWSTALWFLAAKLCDRSITVPCTS